MDNFTTLEKENTMKLTTKMIATGSLLIALAAPAMAQDRPAGYWALDCDPDRWTRTTGSKGQTLYWLNPTCLAASGGSDSVATDAFARVGNGADNGNGGNGADNGGSGNGPSNGDNSADNGNGNGGNGRAGRGNRSGLGDGTNPGRGAGRDRSPNEGANNPGGRP
jgi:hypothetical protein